ncbi:MAG: S41 family peptidase [Clostridia bacterium]|nr:S41 family peptidase [Clostridia bacterium]
MTNKEKTWISGFIGGAGAAVILCGAAFYLQYGALPFSNESVMTGTTAQKTAKIEKIVENNYLEDVETQTLADGMYAGMVASLEDPYSAYYSKENYEKLKESIEGIYTGIGLVMQQDATTKEISVVECYEGRPAAEAGIMAGDIISKIDGQELDGLSLTEVSALIKSDAKEEVKITLQRDGEPMDVTVSTDTIEVQVVTHRMLEDSIGYLQISEFTEGTSAQFEAAYKELKDEKMEGMIIDLRNNPGGLLTSVCDTLEQILPEGMIVYTEDKSGYREEHICDGKSPIEVPLVVLVNGESASAAEIFAGAVKDHEIATLVGTTTFGKGIVQKTYPLSDGSAVKVTVSKYYTPNGVNIHGTGITPDITVEWPEDAEEFASPKQFNQLDEDEWLSQDDQMQESLDAILSLIAKKTN